MADALFLVDGWARLGRGGIAPPAGPTRAAGGTVLGPVPSDRRENDVAARGSGRGAAVRCRRRKRRQQVRRDVDPGDALLPTDPEIHLTSDDEPPLTLYLSNQCS